MSNKRIFSNGEIIYYSDYTRIKSGCEILKTIKGQDRDAVLNQFRNHQTWQTLSKAYYPYINNDACDISYIKDLYNSSESYIIEDKCYKNYSNYDDNTQCNKNVLYPYGNIVVKKVVVEQFPSAIHLCNWCNNKRDIECKYRYKCDNISPCPPKKDECNCARKKHCGLCKNARPLFI